MCCSVLSTSCSKPTESSVHAFSLHKTDFSSYDCLLMVVFKLFSNEVLFEVEFQTKIIRATTSDLGAVVTWRQEFIAPWLIVLGGSCSVSYVYDFQYRWLRLILKIGVFITWIYGRNNIKTLYVRWYTAFSIIFQFMEVRGCKLWAACS